MSRTLTTAFRAALLAERAGDPILELCTITHPNLPTLRFVRDRVDLVSRGETYLAFPFEITLPEDDEQNPPLARLRISNVSRQIVEGIRSVKRDERLQFTLEVVRAADPDTVEFSLPTMDLLNVQVTAMTITGDIGSRLARPRRWPGGVHSRFLPSTHPGVFA